MYAMVNMANNMIFQHIYFSLNSYRLVLILVAACLALSGCATVGNADALQFIEVRTIASNQESLGNADCVLKNDHGTWNVVTPGRVQVVSRDATLHITCNKPGYRVGVNKLDVLREGRVLGDLGGLGKLVIGGASTQKPAFMTQGGDTHTKRYPASVVVVMSPVDSPKTEADGSVLTSKGGVPTRKDLNDAQKFCADIGLIKGSEPFGMCVLKLIK